MTRGGKLNCLQGQSNAFGKQLVGIARGVLDQTVATPFLDGQLIVAIGLGSLSPVAGFRQPIWCIRVQHLAEDSHASGGWPEIPCPEICPQLGDSGLNQTELTGRDRA
jgi:hypothetical protein